MSSLWKLSALGPPEYFNTVVKASSDIDLKLYLSELGLSNNLKRISSEVDITRRFNGEFSSTNVPAPFIDPPLVSSEAWSRSTIYFL